MRKMVHCGKSLKPEAIRQIVLPDRSIFNRTKNGVKIQNLKFKNSNETFLVIFKHYERGHN